MVTWKVPWNWFHMQQWERLWFSSKIYTLLAQEKQCLNGWPTECSALCRNHEAALWYSTHYNLYKHLVQGGPSLKSGTAILRQRENDFIPLNEIMMCNCGWVGGGGGVVGRKQLQTASFYSWVYRLSHAGTDWVTRRSGICHLTHLTTLNS